MAAEGPVSLGMYYLYYFNSLSVIRRVNTDESQNWMAALTIESFGLKMAIDLSELNVYLTNMQTSVNVVNLQASDGTILASLTFSSIKNIVKDLNLFILPDNSGFYLSGNTLSDQGLV